MPYSYVTAGNAIASLGRQLYDPTNQFWTSAELLYYIQEALQTWNAMTSFWRDAQTFTLSANNNNLWYDLSSVTGTIRPSNTTDNAIIQAIEYSLLEPLTSSYPLTWTGSNQYTAQDLLDALQRRRDELLGVTGCTLTRTLVNAVTNNLNTSVGTTTIDYRRIAWIPGSNATYSPVALRQSDDRELQDFAPTFLAANAAAPSSWRISAQVPLTFAVNTLPPAAGNYETLTTNSGANLSANASTVLPIPNDWCWVLKFGALADLFARDGLARDDLRSQYCEQRYDEGVGLLFEAAALLSVRSGNNTLQIDAVRNADDYNPAWMNKAFGVPSTVYTAGLNLIAFSPPANSNASITAQVVENAPLPANNNDQIQLGPDDYSAVLDYAQHLASLKMGGAEFMSTIPLYQGFLKRAALYNSKLTALATMQRPMYQTSAQEDERNPLYSPGVNPRGSNG